MVRPGRRASSCRLLLSVSRTANRGRDSWFRRISLAEFTSIRYNETMHFFVDTAYDEKKKKTDNDPSGILAACMIGANIYIYNAMQVWKTFPDLIRFLPEYMSANLASAHSSLRIEPKANGISVVQTLEAISSLNVTRTPSPTDSKAERLHAVSPTIECGRVWIVEGDWNDEFVDILGYAINYFKNDDFEIPKNINNLF